MRRPLRLMHVIPSLECGGAENQALMLLNGFDPDVFERHLVTFRGGDTANRRALDPGVTHHLLRITRKGQPQWILRMAKLLNQVKPNVVHTHMFDASLYTALAMALSGTGALVTTEHGQGKWKRRIHHLAESRIISPMAYRRVTVSADIAKELIETGDSPEQKTTVIRNGVKSFPHPERNPDAHEVRIVTVGRLEPPKNYENLLKAFSLLTEAGMAVSLHFIGDGTQAQNLKEMARSLNISEKVVFEGYRSDVGESLGKYDIFALSSVSEGLPVAMLEAMGAGLPVVATSVGGIPETLHDGVEGYLVPPQQPTALAQALSRLVMDPSLRALMGDNGRFEVESRYGVGAMCDKYESLYQAIDISRRRRLNPRAISRKSSEGHSFSIAEVRP